MAFSANSFRTSTLLISKDTDHSPLPFFFSICTFSCTVVTHLEHLSSSSTRFKLLSNRRNLKNEGHKRKPFLLKFSFFHRIILKQKKKKKRKERTKKGIDDEREKLVARDSSANTSISFIITTSHPLELHDDQALSHIFSCLLSFSFIFFNNFFLCSVFVLSIVRGRKGQSNAGKIDSNVSEIVIRSRRSTVALFRNRQPCERV